MAMGQRVYRPATEHAHFISQNGHIAILIIAVPWHISCISTIQAHNPPLPTAARPECQIPSWSCPAVDLEARRKLDGRAHAASRKSHVARRSTGRPHFDFTTRPARCSPCEMILSLAPRPPRVLCVHARKATNQHTAHACRADGLRVVPTPPRSDKGSYKTDPLLFHHIGHEHAWQLYLGSSCTSTPVHWQYANHVQQKRRVCELDDGI